MIVAESNSKHDSQIFEFWHLCLSRDLFEFDCAINTILYSTCFGCLALMIFAGVWEGQIALYMYMVFRNVSAIGVTPAGMYSPSLST